MTKKKKIAIISAAAAAAVIALSVGVTLAYLGRTGSVVNHITVGHGDGAIEEEFSSPTELQMIHTSQKKLTIKNTGTVPVFARMFVEFSDSEIAGKATLTYDGTEYSWAALKALLADPDTATDWRYMEEKTANGELGGYFYYTSTLPVGEETPPLFTSVKVEYGDDAEDQNIDKIQNFEVIVYGECVQTVETGSKTVGGVVNYGYEYQDSEWEDAWRSYLKMPAAAAP